MGPRKPDDKKKSPFFEIKDGILIAKIFDVATKRHVPITLWLKNQTVKFETELTSEEREYKTIIAKYPDGFDPLTLTEAMKAQGNEEILGSLNIDALSLFFKSACEQPPQSKFLYVSMPKSIFKLSRRANVRIPFARELAPTVSIFDPTKEIDHSKPVLKTDMIVFRMLDLSVGGCAVAARIEEKGKLLSGTVIGDMRFLIRGMEIVTNATIKHVMETVNDRGKPMLRLGLQFGKLNWDAETNISRFVMDESRKLFTFTQ